MFLQQRLAAGNLNERTIKRCDKIDNLLQRLFFPFVKCVLGVAIIAAQVAERQPHKSTTLPGPGALALDRLINFVDRQCFFAHSLGMLSTYRPHFWVASAKLERFRSYDAR